MIKKINLLECCSWAPLVLEKQVCDFMGAYFEMVFILKIPYTGVIINIVGEFIRWEMALLLKFQNRHFRFLFQQFLFHSNLDFSIFEIHSNFFFEL